jgi:beta-xylosidase
VHGPWEAQGKPLWYNSSDEDVQRTGHADVFEDGEGDWWAVFLGVRPVKDEDGNYLEPQMGELTLKHIYSSIYLIFLQDVSHFW